MRELALGLVDLGIEPGDRVSILSHTRPEWTYACFATFAAGAIVRVGLPDELDCVEAGEVSGREPYDAVVLGSAVYMKGWRGDARHLLRKHVQ